MDELTKMDIESYKPYFENGNWDKLPELVNWVFVDLPYSILRFNFYILESILEKLNFSDLFINQQGNAFDRGVEIFNNLGGATMKNGSLIAFLFSLLGLYLGYLFFFQNRQFGRKCIHALLVVFVFQFWFSTGVNVNNKSQTGGEFLITSVRTLSNDFKREMNKSLSTLSGDNNFSSENLEENALFSSVIKETFYLINSGSTDGNFGSGVLDSTKLIMPLNEKDRKKFDEERHKYINSLVEDNPYFRQNLDKTMEKSAVISLGFANLSVVGLPVAYINVMTSLVEVVVLMMILLFPVFVSFSFFPRLQNVVFRALKMTFSLLFFPLILSIILAGFLWINHLIDTVLKPIFSITGSISTFLTGGQGVVVSAFTIFLIKFVVLVVFFKNRYKILGLFTDNKVEGNVLEQKIHEKATQGVKVLSGAVMTGAGVALANPQLVMEGANMALNQFGTSATALKQKGEILMNNQSLTNATHTKDTKKPTEETKEKKEERKGTGLWNENGELQSQNRYKGNTPPQSSTYERFNVTDRQRNIRSFNFEQMTELEKEKFFQRERRKTGVSEVEFLDKVVSGEVSTWQDLERLKEEHTEKFSPPKPLSKRKVKKINNKVTHEWQVQTLLQDNVAVAKKFFSFSTFNRNYDYGDVNRGLTTSSLKKGVEKATKEKADSLKR
ncbi:hypothetical protein SAMN02745116_01413 [Pilibacter termitis]|uniref:TrbL/VirB6 plasmid conjugal transfer protein n=1 Tax=Pilibacter termitis TaxID=263852 RepID=A0A1T4NF58_9ENTE|nr:hypothetical protein [Pilibacter termitis]SJZ77900.1 hypothetical protein SAMN02745116_01413 [Pilibacter termitis]